MFVSSRYVHTASKNRSDESSNVKRDLFHKPILLYECLFRGRSFIQIDYNSTLVSCKLRYSIEIRGQPAMCTDSIKFNGNPFSSFGYKTCWPTEITTPVCIDFTYYITCKELRGSNKVNVNYTVSYKLNIFKAKPHLIKQQLNTVALTL
jgi:hypothetical protein